MRRIVYIIGAGLTKSLETAGHPVPTMWGFASTMADYLGDDIVLTTMAELESADLYEWKSEEARKLAKIVVGRSANRTPATRDAFKQALKNRPSESIEDLLERSLKGANFSAEHAHQRFKYAINRLFCLVAWNANLPPLERFLQSQFRIPDTEHTFVSFNYDLILDHAVQRSCSDWAPRKGYGVDVPLQVLDDLPSTEKTAGTLDYVQATQCTEAPRCRIKILKPHGSLNWLVPYRVPYEQAVEGLKFLDGPLIVPVTPKGVLRYWPCTRNFQHVAPPGEMPMEVGLCILPPSSAKHSELPFLKRTREMEADALSTADEIVVIGWSVPETDLDQAELVETAVATRQTPLERVIVVNRGAATAYFHRLAALFHVESRLLRVYNSGFVDFAAGL
jgi:hypothetical protein